MQKKLLSLALVLAMIFALAIPAFAADTPVITATYNKGAKTVTITVDDKTQSFTGVTNNTTETYTVNGWEVNVTAKNDVATINSKKAVVTAAAEDVTAAGVKQAESTNTTSSNSQIVVNAETRIWQDGFGFHCNDPKGNGATSVKFEGKTYEKGVQKDVFGTKSNPITLVRVGTTTTWDLVPRNDIVCATCGRTDWVTYSNNSGVINGKNIQANHGSLIVINKVWQDEDGEEIEGDNSLVSFNGNFTLGANKVQAGTYTITETQYPEGFEPIANNLSVTVKAGESVTVTFTNQKQLANIEIVKVWLDVEGNKITDEVRLSELNASFSINGVNAQLGNNEVKAGTYTVSELSGMTAGFSLVSDNDVEVTVAAGESTTVTFTNQEQVPPETYADIVIEKTVDGKGFAAWIEMSGYSDDEIEEILEGISFNLYQVTGKGDDIAELTPISTDGVLDVDLPNNGYSITFGEISTKKLPSWFAIEENLTGKAARVFEEVDPMYIYVGESGYNSYGTKVVSDLEYGAIVTESRLPKIWEDQLDTTKLQTLYDMGAKWIWASTEDGTIDTYQYGVVGSEAKFEITVGSPKDQEVTIHFVCDNAAVIYVNGELAACTATAFNGKMNLPQTLTPDITAQKFFKTLGADEFDHPVGAWSFVYSEKINLKQGENKIVIYAANTAAIPDTETYWYNTDNNPCGLIFALEVPGEAFDNKEIPKVYGDPVVQPMVSVGSEENGYVDAAGDWGEALWANSLPYKVFVTPGDVDDNGDFISSVLDAQGEFIWDKSKEFVTNEENPEGGDLAYFKFEYGFEAGADLSTLKFTDFKIAADNEFCLLVNGKIVTISKNFANLTKMTMGDNPELFFEESYLAGLYNEFMALNDPSNNIGEVYSWTELYPISAEDMLAAFVASGGDSVVIEIYAYNVPEKTEILAEQSGGVAINPAMVIFAGSFAYETIAAK